MPKKVIYATLLVSLCQRLIIQLQNVIDTSYVIDKFLKQPKGPFPLIHWCFMACSLHQIKNKSIAVSFDESSMLSAHDPWLWTSLHFQSQALQIFIGIGKGDDIIPVSIEEINFDILLQQRCHFPHTPFRIDCILPKNSHVAHVYALVFERVKGIFVYVEIFLDSHIVGTPINFQIILRFRSISLRYLIEFAKSQTKLSHQRFLRRCFSTIAISIHIILINSINQIFKTFMEKLAASRIRVSFTRALPIRNELRINKIMRYHKLNPIMCKILPTQYPIANQYAFYVDWIWVIFVIAENLNCKIRNVLSSVGFSSNIKGVVSVFGKFILKKIFEGEKIILDSVGIIIFVFLVFVDTKADSCWRVNKKKISKIGPSKGVEGQVIACAIFL